MPKLFISVFSLLFTVNALASVDYVGSWCQRFDDFTEVLIIDGKDQVVAYTVGNQAGEKSPLRKGFVSLGASGFQIVLDKSDLGVVDYKVRKGFLSGHRHLILKKDDGEREKFTECSRR